jgi:hypothetical protein
LVHLSLRAVQLAAALAVRASAPPAPCDCRTQGVRAAIILSGLAPGNIGLVMHGENVGTIFIKQ